MEKKTKDGIIFFFFQAEDGIRDWSVTGVQTCALPIFYMSGFGAAGSTLGVPDIGLMSATEMADRVRALAASAQIGRASCRERV